MADLPTWGGVSIADVVTRLGTVLLLAVGLTLASPRAATAGGQTTTSRPPITVTVVLTHHRVVAGTPIKGKVVFTNTSARAVTVNSCAADGWLQVAVKNRTYTPQFTHTLVACPPSVHLKPGTVRFPITVLTTYDGCVETGGQSSASVPACLPGNLLPPLPPGNYVTTASISGLEGSTTGPRPVPVVLLRPRR